MQGILKYWKGAGGLDQNGHPLLLLAIAWKDRAQGLAALDAMAKAGVSLKGSLGRKALVAAIREEWPEGVHLLLSHGADPAPDGDRDDEDVLGHARNAVDLRIRSMILEATARKAKDAR